MESYLMWLLSGLGPLLRGTIKNEKSKARFRKVCLSVFTALRLIYAGDEAFQ